MPVAAPRAYGLSMTDSTLGYPLVKPFRSQKTDHGATVRMRPASQK
jgi:hypothetical protein